VTALAVCCLLDLAAVAKSAAGPLAAAGAMFGLICAAAALISARRTIGLRGA